ncbi:unnamed protein product [Symbiodinium sp. CCMP2592]|nr:unnamed protein product [Symbiodinium sp. CCMP2592]
MDAPMTSTAVKPDEQVMSAQPAEGDGRAPLPNGTTAGTSGSMEVEAETGARSSGPVRSTGSELEQDAGRGDGNEGEGATRAPVLPGASTLSAQSGMREERCVDAEATSATVQGPETRADITGQAGTSGGGSAAPGVGVHGGASFSERGDESVYQIVRTWRWISKAGNTEPAPRLGDKTGGVLQSSCGAVVAESYAITTTTEAARSQSDGYLGDVTWTVAPGLGDLRDASANGGVNLRSSEDNHTTAILEALTKNLTNLQELQVKSMRREMDGDDVPEQVKTGAVALPMLPGPDSAEAGIIFQDWLAQVAVPMQDLSSSSGIWWAGVISLVRESYSKWLSATPLERLQLEPAGHEAWTMTRWTRVNSRACSMILQSLQEAIRVDLIARRAVQSAPLILFRLHTCYQPGGASARSAVLGSLQNPVHPSTLDEALTWLRSWPRWVQRCKDLNMMIPDSTILAKALTSATAKYVGENPDTHVRTQLLRSSLRIDGQPAFSDVVKYHQHLQAEVESMVSSRAVSNIEPEGESSPAARSQVVTGEPVWTLESLLQAAAKVAGAPHPEPKAPSMNVMALKRTAGSTDDLSMFALVDSGATHALRRATSQEEWDEADPVTVNLAGGESVGLRMNVAGTILVPVSSLTSATSSTPIVPLGALVSQLGYTMTWGKSKCRLEGRNGEIITLRIRDGCPEVTEQEALKLISQLEDARLQELRTSTAETRAKVKAAAVAMEKTWFDHLLAYVDGEISSEALKAVETAPFLREVPRPCKVGLAEPFPEANGWQALKGLEHLNRRTRKRLWSSDQWIVHLFAGKSEKRDLYHLEGHGYVVLELDLERGRTHDLLRSATRRALEYGARKGKIAGIIGGPPQGTFMISRHIVGGPEPLRSNDYPYGNWEGQSDADVWEVNRETQLLTRMIYLHALSTAGRVRSSLTPEFRKEVAFLLEHPRDPRGYLKYQDPLYPDVVSFWRTTLWTEYAMEAGLSTHCFDMAALGKAFTRHTTLGTNLAMKHLNGLRLRWHSDGPPPVRAPACVWPAEFWEHVVLALRDWVPRSFVEDGRGAWVDYDPGELEKDAYEEKDDGLASEAVDRGGEVPVPDGGDQDDEPELKQAPRRDHDEDPDLSAPELVNLIFACGPKLDDLAPKWHTGFYVGLSDSLSKGHLVYIKDDDGERFVHTLHVRAGVHDPGPVDGEFHAEAPEGPGRRVRGKSAGSGNVVGVSKVEVFDESVLKQRAEAVLKDWVLEEAESVVKEVARGLPDDEKIYGMFRHGGKLGVTKATVERPWFARLLNRLFKERAPDAEFAAVYVSMNNEREVHIDKNNAVGAVNYIIPLSMPRRGGELWMELREGDVVSGRVIELISKEGRARYGCAFPLQEGSVFTFDPHRRHAVLPWKGERIVVVGYTPGLLESVPRIDKEMLWDLRFPLPLDDGESGPEVYINALSVSSVTPRKQVEEEQVPLRGGGWQEVIETSDGEYLFKCDGMISKSASSSSSSAPDNAVASVTTESWSDWEMQLVLSEDQGECQTALVPQGASITPSVRKTEVTYTEGVEDILQKLDLPLSVVYTVNPKEVMHVFERWTESLKKEVASLDHAVDKVMFDDPGVREDLDSGKGQLIPMKVVYTVKPPVQLVVDGKRITLLQGRVEPSWWSIMQEGSILIGVLVVYVDDLLLCARTEVIKELAAAIQAMWKTSPLQLVTEGEIRFLGIEISMTTQGFALSQRSYIEELLRLHEVPTRKRDLVPVTKELVSFVASEDEAPNDEGEVRAAQQIAGELLWVSQRTRPDVAFVCSLIGSLATRAPRRALEIGLKTLAYLQRTSGRRLLFEGSSNYLTGFVDASFAPDANRSHTGWIIQLAGNVVAGRSSRQSCISLSTAEAELEAAVEGLVAIQGIQAVLQDIGARMFNMQMHSDSTSALAIAHGSCSWRTRHLRLKSAWISELIAKNVVEFNHCSGEVQPADMLTKPLSSARLKALSCLVALIDEMESLCSVASSQEAVSGERVFEEQGVVVYGSGVSVDYGLVTWILFCCAILVAVIGWEAVKYLVWVIYDRASPGANQRRLRRLQRLRDATAEAIQREVSSRVGSRAEQRARDLREHPRRQLPDPPREQRDVNAEERVKLLRKLAQGVKETHEAAVQTTAFTPVHGPSTRVILRYVHEPAEATYIVPDNDCYHVYDDCHAFRHRGTMQRVERRRLCQYCSHRAADDPDKAADYGRDLERAREYERVFNTTLLQSGQSSNVTQA